MGSGWRCGLPPPGDGDLGTVSQAALLQDGRDVVAHGALGQEQRLRDLAVVESFGDELGDIALALREALGEGGGGLAVIGVRQRVVEGGSGAVRWPLPDERAHAVGDIGSQDDLPSMTECSASARPRASCLMR